MSEIQIRYHTNSLPATMTFENKQASSASDTANLFADFISNVYMRDNEEASNSFTEPSGNTFDIPHLTMNVTDVENALAKLKDTLDFGPDSLPSLFIKR